VAQDDLAGARFRYRAYLGLELPRARGKYELGSMLPADTLRDALRDQFGEHPEFDELEVVTSDGHTIGFVKRAAVSQPDRTAGAQWSDSQGASLPGESTGYRPVWFTCKQHDAWIPVAYYDERYPPSCPKDPADVMEFAP
jgi:hypothetical protein